MIPILELLQSDAAANMSQALLHTLWQGAIVSMALWVILKNISGSRSQFRYRLSVISLLVIVVCWLGTFSILQYEKPLPEEPTVVSEMSSSQLPPSAASVRSEVSQTQDAKAARSATSADDVTRWNAPRERIGYAGWSVILWVAGMCAMLIRLFGALAGAAKLKRTAIDIEDPAIVELFDQLCRRMKIRRSIRLAASATLVHPGVIGFFRPVLLIPLSILNEISAEDLQVILAHELAHIRRFDYLVNFCQMVIEAVLFFNPAVWWISRQIRIEREACCDAVGVAAAGQRTQYARVLFEQIARAASPQPTAAMAMTGFSDDSAGDSEERIRRIIHPQYRPRMKVGWLKTVCWLGVVGIVLMGLYQTTDFAIAVANRMMTPAERVEAMQQINEAYAANGSEMSLFSEDEKITVRGRLITEDGGDLPVRTGWNCQGRPSSWPDIDVQLRPYEEDSWPKLKSDGSFEFQTRLKRFYIIVQPRRDYAERFFGPFEFDPNEIAEGLELTLQRGFTRQILFVNEQNEPVENVQVTGGYPWPPDYSCWSHTIKSVSGVDGVAALEHSINEPVNLTCEGAGYVKEARRKIRLKPDEPYLWKLTATPQTLIHVVSDVTDQPVAGAGVNVEGKEYSQIKSYYVDRPSFVTDDAGLLELKSLNRSETYLVLIHSEGYQRQYIRLRGGEEVVVRLKEFVPIQGKITGDLSGLKTDDDGFYISAREVVRTSDYCRSISSREKVYVDLRDNEAFFQIDDYFGHEIQLEVGSKTHTINLDEDDLGNIVFDNPQPSSYKTQTMTFQFVDAATSEPLSLTGTFKLTYRDHPEENCSQNHDIEIVDGKASVELPVPNRFRWQPTPETGWFFGKGYREVTEDEPVLAETIRCYPAGTIFGTLFNPNAEFSRVYMQIHTVKKSGLLDKNVTWTPIVNFENNIDLTPKGDLFDRTASAGRPIRGFSQLPESVLVQ